MKRSVIFGLWLLICVWLASCGGPVDDANLSKAAAKGDLSAVLSLLDSGADIDASDDWGLTPLISASLNGHVEVVQALLDKGADVHAKDKSGSTALILACQQSDIELGLVRKVILAPI